MTNQGIVTFYTSRPEDHSIFVERLRQAGYFVSTEPVPELTLDPSIRSSKNLYEGPMNVSRFVLAAEEKRLRSSQ